MNKMTFFMALLFLLSLGAQAEVHEECDDAVALPSTTKKLIETLGNVSNGLYTNVLDFKVNLDGEGQLSVFFENGEPKLLKLTYKNKSGTTIEQITFEDLAKGKALEYENPSIPGRAIIVEKAPQFQSGKQYNFKLSFRTGVKPPKYNSHNLEFLAAEKAPLIKVNEKKITQMTFSPGISFFSWDGTFKKVEFE